MQTVLTTNVFGAIRAIAPFRLPGDKTLDYLIIGSDSGKITIVSYDQVLPLFYKFVAHHR